MVRAYLCSRIEQYNQVHHAHPLFQGISEYSCN